MERMMATTEVTKEVVIETADKMARTETAKTETAKTETAKTETAKTETAKTAETVRKMTKEMAV
jgi:hypothetical protein